MNISLPNQIVIYMQLRMGCPGSACSFAKGKRGIGGINCHKHYTELKSQTLFWSRRREVELEEEVYAIEATLEPYSVPASLDSYT